MGMVAGKSRSPSYFWDEPENGVNPGGRACSEPRSHHLCLGNRARFWSLKNKKKENIINYHKVQQFNHRSTEKNKSRNQTDDNQCKALYAPTTARNDQMSIDRRIDKHNTLLPMEEWNLIHANNMNKPSNTYTKWNEPYCYCMIHMWVTYAKFRETESTELLFGMMQSLWNGTAAQVVNAPTSYWGLYPSGARKLNQDLCCA